MPAQAVLTDPLLTSSIALVAVKKLLGAAALEWEPDTIRIELERRGIPTDEAVMAKILSAVTVATTHVWTHDHDALFAFAVACCGVGGSAEALHHPTPEQLCWAMREITAITGHRMDDDVGFDPDAVDPAIAAVLYDEGYVVAPIELVFVQDALDEHNRYAHDTKLKRTVQASWAALVAGSGETLRHRLERLSEDPEGIALRRLGDCHLYVAEHELRRARQYAVFNE